MPFQVEEFYATDDCVTEDGKHDVVDEHCCNCCECNSCISKLQEKVNKFSEDELDLRYCDNDDCPYDGYIYDEELEKYEGKEYVCIGCKTGKGLQEQEQEEGNGWENGIIPNCEKCGNKFAEDGNNYNERDGDEICDDCEKKEEE